MNFDTTPRDLGVPEDSGSLRSSKYRPDIDGLRAYAVMVVVIFHLNPDWLSGGYVGVDIFFVISGYLITKIIVTEKQSTGKFSYANFYTRRVRRLFPAIFVTVIITSVAAVLIFPLSMQQKYISEAIYSLTSLSNIYFWGQAGYFDTEAITKPMLHTWSLAVEEQFYLVWPWIAATLLAKYPSRKALIILFLLSFISYWSNIVMVRMGELDTMFYMMPARIFEFGIGASVVWFERIEIKRNFWAETLVGLGMLGILGSSYFYSEATIFPAQNALIPCIGTAFVIYGGRAKYLGILLRNKLAIGLGMVSYSMYLVHWPIIVFTTYINGGQPSIAVLMSILMATVLLAAIMYKFVEQPIRARQFGLIRNLSNAGVGLAAATLCLLVVTFGFSYSKTIAGSSQSELNFTAITEAGTAYTWAHIYNQAGPYDRNQTSEKVLLIGDSQGADFLNLLWAHDPEYAAGIRTFHSDKFCQIKYTSSFYETGEYKDRFLPPKDQLEKCRIDIAQFVSDRRVEAADAIILSYAWFSVAPKYLAVEIASIKKRNPMARIFVVGRKDQPSSSVAYLLDGIDPERANILAKQKPVQEVTHLNARMADLVGTDYLDVYSTLCGPTICDLFTSSDFPVLFDKRHLTEIGADYVVRGSAFNNNIATLLRLTIN